MRVLVTGGARLVVCRHFVLDLNYEVVVVDKITCWNFIARAGRCQFAVRVREA